MRGNKPMGRKLVEGTITGPLDARRYSFSVDTGSALMGLPLEEIEALGLEIIPNGRRRFMTANAVSEFDTYQIGCEIRGKGFATMVAPCPIPLVGYEMPQNMRLRVNPVSEEVEEVPDDEIHQPYMISMFSI
jgi:predicted aspartyl protease